MAKKINLLVDTDIFIDYFNHQLFRKFFERQEFQIYYSAVTKKELLSKKGLSDASRQAIVDLLKRYRLVPLNPLILQTYSDLRHNHPTTHKEDCLIAATATVKGLPLATRNYKHFKIFPKLRLYFHP